MNKNKSKAGSGEDWLLGDAKRLAGFRQGQQAVLAALYRHYSPQLRAVLYACGLRSRADIDDALQTVFVRAFAPRARQDYSGLSPYGAYLKRIARNIVYDLHKSGRARFELLQPELAEGEISEASWADPQAGLQQDESLRLRDSFLALLRPPEPEVYQACFVQGLTEREAAKALGLTRHRLRRQLDAIRRRLAKFIKEQGLYD